MALHYSFEEIYNCEMCGSATASHRVLGQRLNKSQGLSPKAKSGISVSVMKCTSCGLIYSNPIPIPQNIQDHYGVPPEHYWNEGYAQYCEGYFAKEIQSVKELLPFTKGMKALDIGAGLGKGMLAMDQAGFDTYGLEASVPFYERAIARMGIAPHKLSLGMVEALDYEKESFDFISYGAVFEHLYHPAFCLEKSLQWLKRGGLIHVEVPSADYLIPKLINTYFRVMGTNYVNNLSPMHNPFHLYEFSKRSFEKLGKKLGFEIVKEELFVGTITHVPKFLHPLLRKIMKATNSGMQITLYIRKL